jgi:hypothetical protein
MKTELSTESIAFGFLFMGIGFPILQKIIWQFLDNRNKKNVDILSYQGPERRERCFYNEGDRLLNKQLHSGMEKMVDGISRLAISTKSYHERAEKTEEKIISLFNQISTNQKIMIINQEKSYKSLEIFLKNHRHGVK